MLRIWGMAHFRSFQVQIARLCGSGDFEDFFPEGFSGYVGNQECYMVGTSGNRDENSAAVLCLCDCINPQHARSL